MSEFLCSALDVGKNTCFANEWQWFHNELMYRFRVIDNQRFGKVMKKATHYPQIWHVNLETLSLFCLKTENQNKIICYFFSYKKKDLKLYWFNTHVILSRKEINCVREKKQLKNHASKLQSIFLPYVCKYLSRKNCRKSQCWTSDRSRPRATLSNLQRTQCTATGLFYGVKFKNPRNGWF